MPDLQKQLLLQNLLALSASRSLLFRLKIRNQPLQEEWSHWIIQPSESYLETEKDGPLALNTIEWLEIDPVERISPGKYILEKVVDHSENVTGLLHNNNHRFLITDNKIRILF